MNSSAGHTVEPAASRRYYVTDHLGSTRAVVDPSKPAGSKVIETRDYMPYGSRMPGRVSNQAPTETREDYTGHELDSETGMHYAGARYYMSEIGRWNGPDPLADDFPAWSPYAYSYNNPIGFTDPTGMAPEDEFRVDRKTGNIEKISDKGGDKVDTYHIGQYVGGGTNFTVARTVDIERTDSGIQINAFRIEHGTDYKRTDDNGNPEGYTLSTFHAPGDSEVSGFAVEPGGAATTTANLDLRIPEGDYNIDPNAEGEYDIGLSNEQVPASRKIKMHAGNFGRDTAGCWMPNTAMGNKMGARNSDNVGSSNFFTNTIKPKIQNAGGGTLTIVDDPNMTWRPNPQ